jgi:hypothetical protein
MKNQIYIYLASRDKKGIKMITNFPNKAFCYPTKLNIANIKNLNLSNNTENLIKLEFEKDKLTHELYIESATSPSDLRSSLIRRGYKNIPLQLINLRINESSKINEDALITKKSTMIRKYSDQSNRT